MVGSRNLRDVRSEPIVPASEPELVRSLVELDVRVDAGHLVPRDADAPTTSQPSGDPADHTRPRTPDSGAAEDRDHFEIPARRAFERDVVDLAATPSVGVEQLMVEQVQTEVDRLRQFCPTFVRIMSGMAVTAITMITTRYRIPNAFAIRPFVYSRM